MRWQPGTKTAELRGGHLDGQRYTIQRVGEPFRVPRPSPPVWEMAESGEPTLSLADTYELVGWREVERVWVYEARHAGE